MEAYKTEAKIQGKGELHLAQLPFRAGESVEVILLRRETRTHAEDPYPLRGKPFRLDRPFDPVAEDDWDVLK